MIRHHDAVARAQNSLAAADRDLATQFTGYSTRTRACVGVANPYQCIEQADLALVPHLGAYGQALGHAGDAGLAPSVIDQARADARQAARAFQMVGRAPPTKAGYTVAVTQSKLSSLVSRLQSSVNAIIGRLNPGRSSSG
jgi:hypothetical protein